MQQSDVTKAQKILGTIISYARQPSTYRGLIAVLAGLGLAIEPQHYQAALAGLVLLYGAINFFRNEHKPKITPELVEQAGQVMLKTYLEQRRQRRGSNANRERRPADAG